MALIEIVLSQDEVRRLGWSLVHFVWQGATVAPLLALVLWLARRRSAGIRRVLRLPGEKRWTSPTWKAASIVLVAIVATTAASFVRAQQQDPSQRNEQESPAQSALQDLWQKLDELGEEQRGLARRRWDAINVVEQAELVRHGWRQAQEAPSVKPPRMTEAEARKFLAGAKRQLGKRWEAHLATEMLDTLSRKEQLAFQNRRKAVVEQIAALGEPVVGALIREITAGGSRGHEIEATQALKRIRKPAVPALLEAVESAEDRSRRVLLEILVDIRDPRARETFSRLLNDPDPHTRLASLEGLGALGCASQDVYLRCLEDGYDWLRRTAIIGLREVGDEKAIAALMIVVDHDLHQGKGAGFFLRREAVEALNQIAQRTGKPIELPPETWKQRRELTFETLSAAARCDNAGIRRDAIFRLGGLREGPTLKLLLDLFRSDPVPQNRAGAVSALYDLLARTGEDAHRLQLSHAEREPVFNAVLDAVLREEPLVSRKALGYIGGIAGEYLPDYERFPELFALALGYIEGEDRGLQLAGVQVIWRLGRWHSKALDKHLSPERRDRLVAELKTGMEDSEVTYRIRFIQALGYLREPSVVPRLIELLRDEDAIVRSFVIHALGRIGDRRALSSLEKLAQTDPTTNDKGDFYLRKYAQNAIEQIRERTGQSVELPAEEDARSGPPGVDEAVDQTRR